MDRIKPIDTEKYLEKVVATDLSIPREELADSLARLTKPFDGLISTEDEIIIKSGGYSIHITFSHIQPTIPPTPESNSEQYSDYPRAEHIIFEHDDIKFDLTEIIPETYKIFVDRQSKAKYGSVDTRGNVFIYGDITTPKMVLILLHEIGHVVDNSRPGSRDIAFDHPNADIALEIRSERAASAFALKFMRPFIRDTQERKDVVNLLKHDALQGYYRHARGTIESRKKTNPDLDRYARDLAEDSEKDAEW